MGGPAGASAGWLIGSWAGGMLSDGEIIDPGMQGLPLLNNSLRGLTMPVVFGTVRVTSNLVWKDKFTVKKKKEKEGGGSGAPGITTITYTYKMDYIFNVGIVPTSYTLHGGWVGAKPINDNSLASLSTSSDGNGYTQLNFGDDESFDINADQIYIYNGGDQDSGQAGWAYFNSRVGLTDVRWPSSFWVGFKQYDMGGSPAIPNINFVIGPSGADVEFTPSYTGSIDNPTSTQSGKRGRASTTDKFGQQYLAAGGELNVVSKVGAIVSAWTQATSLSKMKVQANTQWGDDTIVDPQSNGPQNGAIYPIMNGEYIVWWTYVSVGFGGGTDYQGNFCLLRPNDGAEPTILGFYRVSAKAGTVFGSFSHIDNGQSFHSANVAGAGTIVDPVVWILSAGNPVGDMWWYVGPSVADMIAGDFTTYRDNGYGWATGEIGMVLLQPPGQTANGTAYDADDVNDLWDYYTWSAAGNGTSPGGGVFMLPHSVNNRMYTLMPPQECQDHIDGVVTNGKPFATDFCIDNPGGWIAYWDIGTLSTDDAHVGAALRGSSALTDNPLTIDTSMDVTAWTEEGAGIVNPLETDANANYDPKPIWIYKANTTDFYVAWGRQSNADSDNADPPASGNGNMFVLEARIFKYSRATGTWSLIKKLGGLLINGDDEGFGNSNHDDIGYVFWYDAANNQLLYHNNGLAMNFGADGTNEYYTGKFADFNLGATDLTPPEIIRDVLTHSVFGVGFTAADLNAASLNAAIAYCQDRDIKVSTQFRTGQNYLDIIELCLAVYGGYLSWSGDKIKFGVVTGQETPVRTLDNSHFVIERNGEGDPDEPVVVTKGALQDAYNLVRINYQDRNLAYRKNQVEIGDEVDQDLNGIRLSEFPPQFVMTEDLANRMAVRTLWSNLYARDIYEFKVGWKDSDLEPGDIVTLVDSFSGLNNVARIVLTREEERGVTGMRAVDELGYDATATLDITSATTASSVAPLGSARQAAFFSAYELPREYQGADSKIYVGWRPGNRSAGALLYRSSDNVTFSQADEVTVYPDAGIILTDLPNDKSFIENIIIAVAPGSGFNASSGAPLAWDEELSDTNHQGRAVGQTAMWVGSEMLAWEDSTLLAQNIYRLDRVHRGWGGTHVHSHASGDTYWHQGGGGIFELKYNVNGVGSTMFYKVVPIGFNGVAAEVTSIAAKSYTVQGQYYRPQVLDHVHIYVGSSDASYPEDMPLPKGPASDGGDLFYLGSTSKMNVGTSKRQNIVATWELGARQSGYGAGGYGLDGSGGTGWGRFQADATSTSWRVEVVGSGDVVVNSSVVTTPFFEYSKAQNISDNGAWRGNVAIQITPFNDQGDALRVGVRSMELV